MTYIFLKSPVLKEQQQQQKHKCFYINKWGKNRSTNNIFIWYYANSDIGKKNIAFIKYKNYFFFIVFGFNSTTIKKRQHNKANFQ